MDPNINGSYWDVALLSMLFLHRYKLLRLGMWGDDFHVRERRLSIAEDSYDSEDASAACKVVFSAN